MLKITLLSLLALSAPILAADKIDIDPEEICKFSETTRADVFIEASGALSGVTLPSDLVFGFHLEKSFCVPYVKAGLAAAEADATESKDLENLIKNYNATAHAAPYYFREAEFSLPTHPGSPKPLLHKPGTESYAESYSVACSAEGWEDSVDQACGVLAGRYETREYKASSGGSVAGKNADMHFTLETYDATSIKMKDCVKLFSDFFNSYTWTSEDSKSKNITGGWTYANDGNLRASFEWQSGYQIETAGDKVVSYCSYGSGDKARSADNSADKQNSTTDASNVNASNGEDDKESGAAARKSVWGSLLALAGFAAVVMV